MLLFTGALFLLGGSAIPPGGLSSQVHSLTRPIEFDFGTWTLDAVFSKISDWGLSLQYFISPESQSHLVLVYLDQVRLVQSLNAEILALYSNPSIEDANTASQGLRVELEAAEKRLSELAPLAEAILQAQLTDVLEDAGLDVLGQVLPPSLFQFSDVPQSLIISPRTEIKKILEISLTDGMSAEDMEQLESGIFAELDVAALIVPIGGIGTYPTMVMQTTNIVWLLEVIAHEWTHNFLTLHPLGINYDTNSELRTINETTASLVGKELGLMILEKYYPEYVPQEVQAGEVKSANADLEPTAETDKFDFQAEMRITRVEVDRLLAGGEVKPAEAYMEARRQFFWENGYSIRKLNQAYFAFYGAYNDDPGGGAAGVDPVGPAVVAFRAQFESVADFLNAISWVDSFDELLGLVAE